MPLLFSDAATSTLTTSITTSTTSLVVASVASFPQGMVAGDFFIAIIANTENTVRETIKVTAVDYTTKTLTVIRGYDSTIPFAWPIGSKLEIRVGSSLFKELTALSESNTLSKITSATVVGALGYTPYNSTNPNSYITASSNQNTQVSSLGVGIASSGTGGEIRATNNVTAFYSSDIKLKENINSVYNPLNIVCQIGSKTFDWTDDYIKNRGGEDGYFVRKSDFGVIAQDVEKVFPLAIRKREDGTLAVDYEKLSTLAFGAIEQLLSKIETLDNRIKELENKSS
jgi:hypothetical protein